MLDVNLHTRMEPNFPPQTPARPTFLTVLCILTFIASAYGIITGISGYRNANISAEMAKPMLDSAQQEIRKESADNETAAKMADKVISGASELLDPEKIKKNSLFSILANILTLVGAYVMFQLKKYGFWIYLAGTAFGIITPILVYGASNWMSLGMSALAGFFGIIFAILYSLNLKHMK